MVRKRWEQWSERDGNNGQKMKQWSERDATVVEEKSDTRDGRKRDLSKVASIGKQVAISVSFSPSTIISLREREREKKCPDNADDSAVQY